MSKLAEEYAARLATHLSGSSEAVLLSAYDFGRTAVGDGLGVLELVTMHHEALRGVVEKGGDAGAEQQLDKAAIFFAEALSPFEMLLRGYRETNTHLAATNEKLREAKVQAEAANRELEAFSYSVAHDLRAPLRSVDGYSKVLMEDHADALGDDALHALSRVRDCAQQMARMIDDLLKLSRLTRTEIRREDVDLTALARDIAGRLQERQPERKIDFLVTANLMVRGDPGLLAIVLENLLGNACKFTGRQEQPRIEVGVTASAGCRAHFVRDNGAGFNMAYASKLFGPFQRLHNATEFEGTGIGLATVQRIVQRHGGSIWAEGEVGRGATFFFTLDGEPPATSAPQ